MMKSEIPSESPTSRSHFHPYSLELACSDPANPGFFLIHLTRSVYALLYTDVETVLRVEPVWPVIPSEIPPKAHLVDAVSESRYKAVS